MKKNKSPKVVKKEIGPFADKPIALPEGINMEDHVIATYWIQVDKGWDMPPDPGCKAGWSQDAGKPPPPRPNARGSDPTVPDRLD